MGLDISNHKLMYHPDRVAEWKQKGDCYPVYIEIGLTNSCNHRCVFCALDFMEGHGKFIDREVMLKALKEMGSKGVRAIMFAGEGESILHPDLSSFIQTAKENKIDISITTNGVALTKEKIREVLPHLSWIRFSVDSGSSENYSEIHGTNAEDFEKLLENVRECVRLKKELGLGVVIGVQFLMIPQNKGEVVKLARTMKEIGADNIQIKPYSKHPNSINDLIINPEEYNEIEQELKEFDSENFKVFFRKATAERIQEGINYPECYGIPFFALVDAKGDVVPCNLFYGNEEFTYGNLNEQSFSEIWEGDKRKEILKKLKERGCEECRKGCRLDVINRYLHRLKNPEMHDNFI